MAKWETCCYEISERCVVRGAVNNLMIIDTKRDETRR